MATRALAMGGCLMAMWLGWVVASLSHTAGNGGQGTDSYGNFFT